MFHDGSRQLQQRFGTRSLADRLELVEARAILKAEDRALIERCAMFFLATSDAQGRPLCSYKGGAPGFVHIADEATLAFPSYDGNGTFRSLGNVLVNPQVSLLFIDFETQERTLVEGAASVSADDPLLGNWHGAQLIVRVNVTRAFSSCPRYIHRMQLVEHSEYVPRPGCQTPDPDWKKKDVYQEVLPEADTGSTPRDSVPKQTSQRKIHAATSTNK